MISPLIPKLPLSSSSQIVEDNGNLYFSDSMLIVWKEVHDRKYEFNHRGKVVVFHHISWPNCPCNFAKEIRLRDMGIEPNLWYGRLWDVI